MAKFIPIFKAEDNTNANNYRPISLLSNFNRIFEKLVYSRRDLSLSKMTYFLHLNMASTKCIQHMHAILDIVSTIQENTDKRLFLCGVFKRLLTQSTIKFFSTSYITMVFDVL